MNFGDKKKWTYSLPFSFKAAYEEMHDTWEEEALQKVKWHELLRKATSAVEEQPQQEYQRAHDPRHSSATLGIFQCNNIVSVIADPERV